MKRRTKAAIGVAIVLVIALVAGGFALWQVLGGAAPPPVALNSVSNEHDVSRLPVALL